MRWLKRNWTLILVELILFYALLNSAFVWELGLWLWIYPNIRILMVEVFGALIFLAIWITGNMKWLSRIGCSALAFVFVCAIVFVGGGLTRALTIAEEEYLGSVRLDGSVYHLVSVKLSGQYYSIYRCDDLGMACEEVDYFAGFTTNERVALMAHPDAHSLVVLFLGENGYEVLHEYHSQPESSP